MILAQGIGQDVAEPLRGIDHRKGHGIGALAGLAIGTKSLLRRGRHGKGEKGGDGECQLHFSTIVHNAVRHDLLLPARFAGVRRAKPPLEVLLIRLTVR